MSHQIDELTEPDVTLRPQDHNEVVINPVPACRVMVMTELMTNELND